MTVARPLLTRASAMLLEENGQTGEISSEHATKPPWATTCSAGPREIIDFDCSMFRMHDSCKFFRQNYKMAAFL